MLIEPTIQAPLHRNYPIIDESSSSNSIAYAPNTFWIHTRPHQTEYAFHVRFHRLISIIGCTCKMIPESSGTSKPLNETHPHPPFPQFTRSRHIFSISSPFDCLLLLSTVSTPRVRIWPRSLPDENYTSKHLLH